MPVEFRSPGLRKRTRGKLNVYYWVCRRDIGMKGYPVKTARLWSGEGLPTNEELSTIRNECFRLNSEMKEWNKDPSRRKGKRYRQSGKVYFIRSGAFIKIGFAANIRARMSNLKVGTPGDLELLGTIPGNRHIEEFLHWQFRKSHHSGEWFIFDESIQSFVAEHVATENTKGSKIVNGTMNAGTPVLQAIDIDSEYQPR